MKNKKTIVVLIILVIIAVVAFLGVKSYLDKDLEKQEQDLANTIDKYGYLEQENVSTTVAKFNTEVMDNGLNYPASEEYFTVDNQIYWYGLYDDISLYIKAKEFTNDRQKDITDMMAIYYKDNENAEMAKKYAKYLIKANNNDLTDEEINYLIEEAEKLSDKKEMANNGKGVSVGLNKTDDHYEYQVKRLYK